MPYQSKDPYRNNPYFSFHLFSVFKKFGGGSPFFQDDPKSVSTWVPIGGGPKKNLLRVKNEFA